MQQIRETKNKKTNKQENVKSNDWKSMESRDSANIEENHIKNQEFYFFLGNSLDEIGSFIANLITENNK